MTIVKHRPRHDEALVPVEKPRGVAPAPLRGRPGIAADVLRELRADGQPTPADRAALAKLAGPMHGIPTRWLRPVPLAAIVVDDINTVAADVAAMHAALDDRQAARFAATLDMLTSWAAGLPALDTDWTAQLAEQLAEVAR